jgi:hypothetical protein
LLMQYIKMLKLISSHWNLFYRIKPVKEHNCVYQCYSDTNKLQRQRDYCSPQVENSSIASPGPPQLKPTTSPPEPRHGDAGGGQAGGLRLPSYQRDLQLGGPLQTPWPLGRRGALVLRCLCGAGERQAVAPPPNIRIRAGRQAM